MMNDLCEAMITCNKNTIDKSVTTCKNEGFSSSEIIDGLSFGMSKIGDLFERGKLFLPHVMMAATAMKDIVSGLNMESDGSIDSKKIIINGTVEGDVHDIGKSIVSTMLQSSGFTVYDLGRDVPVKKFIESVKEHNAGMIGLSALMTTTLNGQKEVIELLIKEGLRDKIKVMVGGAPATEVWAKKIGADCYAENATDAVSKAKKLLL